MTHFDVTNYVVLKFFIIGFARLDNY